MASAICPNCRIALVEATSSSMANLDTAVNGAVSLGATYVSNSYGGGDSSSDATYDSTYINHPGVAITVSAGDAGRGADGRGRATYGGTSTSAPIIASVYALAGTPSTGSYPPAFPYANTSALNDVTSGSNGSRTTGYFCTARTGYDGPTGLGTLEGVGAVTGRRLPPGDRPSPGNAVRGHGGPETAG